MVFACYCRMAAVVLPSLFMGVSPVAKAGIHLREASVLTGSSSF
jgi:hypothetical protein